MILTFKKFFVVVAIDVHSPNNKNKNEHFSKKVYASFLFNLVIIQRVLLYCTVLCCIICHNIRKLDYIEILRSVLKKVNFKTLIRDSYHYINYIIKLKYLHCEVKKNI